MNGLQAHSAKPTVASQLLQNGVTLKECARASPWPDPGWGRWVLNTSSPRVVVRAWQITSLLANVLAVSLKFSWELHNAWPSANF